MTTPFAIGVVALVLLAAWMLRPAWRAPPAPAGVPLAQPAHLRVLREQLAALDRERDAGQIDAQQHRLARRELERRVLDESVGGDDAAIARSRSPKLLLLVGSAVPLFAIALYGAIGNPAGLSVQPAAAPSQAAAEPEVTPEAMQAMLASLAQRLEKPSGNAATDLQGWTMLARSYASLQRFADADRAYARAIAIAVTPAANGEPALAQLLADRADVLAVLQGQRTAGEPERLIAQALRIDPKQPKALALAGSAAFERKAFDAAIAYWQQARELAPEGSNFATGLDRSIAAAREAGGETASASTSTTAPTAAAPIANGSARITGRVSLSPTLAAKAAPTDTVFVFARAAEGPRMPLAIVRRTVADLPFDFTLDDSQAMSPQTKLSGASRVIVGARISRSGNAMPQAGDLHGESGVVGTDRQGLRLVIDGVQP